MNTAWDGTEAEFWRAVQAHADGTFTEGDAAVLSEVLDLALQMKLTLELEAHMRAKRLTNRT